MKIFSSTFADQPRKSDVTVDIFSNLFPQPTECRHGSGKIDRSKIRMRGDRVPENWPVGWNEIDHARRNSGFLEHFEGNITAQHGRV